VSARRGLDRRQFFKSSTGLVIGFTVASRLGPRFALASAQEAAAAAAKPLPDPNAFLTIGEDESVTVLLAHSEMGQGVWTTLPMLVAEELGCDWSKIHVRHAPAAPVYAHTSFGMQMTGGSTSTYSEYDRYRQVGALAREMLVAAAAERWKVPASTCRVEKGFVVAGNGDKRLSFGKLAAAAQKQTPPREVRLKDPKDWTILGKPTKRLDSPEKVTGKAQFGLDVTLPGMLIAVVERSPVFGGKLRKFSADKAKAIRGVKAVFEVPSGVAVVADRFYAAKLGRNALDIDWDLGPFAEMDSAKLREEYRALAGKPGTQAKAAGDLDAGFRSAAKTLEAEYEFPYLAHATMEPQNCTVRYDAGNGECEIWLGTQFQTMDQVTAAKILGIPAERVKIHTTFLGGGFGRRATPTSQVVSEAVHVAKGAGAPVKVVWTREDDMHGGYYRPAYIHRLRVGVDGGGSPVAWQHAVVGQSIVAGTPFEAMMVKNGVDPTSVEGVTDSPYLTAISNFRIDLHSPRSPVPVLWWRSVGHTHTAYVMESTVDELAHAAGQDPLEYRRRLLKDHPRHLTVVNLAAEKAGWGKPLPAGRFRGIAVHESFESYVAEVAEVSIDRGKIRVHRVVAAIDCGTCINPAGVAAQIESAVVFGMTAALYGELTLAEGRVEQSNFDDYPMVRIPEMPRVEVHIVASREKSGGVGEPGTPPIAPAIANAVFAATGKRLRTLPLRLA
jgi:isoquinoline 1-oxidoreductase beta subunit